MPHEAYESVEANTSSERKAVVKEAVAAYINKLVQRV